MQAATIPPRIKKDCVICGEKFLTNLSLKMTCGKECAVKRNLEMQRLKSQKLKDESHTLKLEKECIVCGKQFETVNPRYTMCGKECYKKRCSVLSLLRYHKLRSENPTPKLEKECVVCGESFRTKFSVKVTCGKKCYKERQAKRKSQWVKTHRDNIYVAPKKLKKECVICGKAFTALRPQYVSCGKECAEKRKDADKRRYAKDKSLQKAGPGRSVAAERECVWCGNEFQPRVHNNVVCSKKCFRERATSKTLAWLRTNAALKTLREKECSWCGSKFKPKHYNTAVCSKECFRKRKNSHALAWNRKHIVNTTVLEKDCAWCSKRFQTKRHDKIYCSMGCYAEKSKKATMDRRVKPGPFTQPTPLES